MCHLFGSTEKLRQSSRGGSLLDTALTSVALAATFAGGRKTGGFLEDFLGNSVETWVFVIWTWTK